MAINEQQVLIPQEIFEQVLELLKNYNKYEYCFVDDIKLLDTISPLYDWFMKKEEKIQLRNSYKKLIFAETKDERDDARINYLGHRNSVKLKY